MPQLTTDFMVPRHHHHRVHDNGGSQADEASRLFDEFCAANTFQGIMSTFQQLCDACGMWPKDHQVFYKVLKTRVNSWKAQSLWTKLDKRAAHKEYKRSAACTNTKVFIIGSGPCGLRTAIEVVLLGGKAVIVEKRDRFSRNNVLHLWPFLIHDLNTLGAKKFFGKFCAGAIDHISIRTLQCILLKVALLVGVEIHPGVTFEGLIDPEVGPNGEKRGWRALVTPLGHVVSDFEFDVIIGADGKRNTLDGFKRKEFRGKLAIAITANFINQNTQAEACVEEISGVAFIFNQKFFRDLNSDSGIDLENIVYYKDETHYFVMTAKKHSLLAKGVLIEDNDDPEKLLARENVNQEALFDYAREAADFSTNHQLPSLEFAHNHYGQPDVAMFDFTSMFAAVHASQVKERNGVRLLIGLVGDSLLEPFWPTGSGCARGFLGALDAAWMIRSWASGTMTPLEVMAERESVYQLLSQTTPENVNKNFSQWTIDPNTRYPNLNVQIYKPLQVKSLYSGCNEAYLNEIVQISERKNKQYELARDSRNLLRWMQRYLEPYRATVRVNDLTSSWQNGLALCALIHRYRPELIDFYLLNAIDVEKNNQLVRYLCQTYSYQMAFDIGEKHFGIAPVMTGKDMVLMDSPDLPTMYAYLAQFYEYFRKEGIRPAKVARLPDVVTESNVGKKSPKSPVSKSPRSRSPGMRPRLSSKGSSKGNLHEREEKENVSAASRVVASSSVGGQLKHNDNIIQQHRDKLEGVTPDDTPRQLASVKRENEKRQLLGGIEVGVKGDNKVSALARDLADKFSGKQQSVASEDSSKPKPRPISAFLQQSIDVATEVSKKPVRPQAPDTCYFCRDRVYLVERYSSQGIVFHRNCFCCEECNQILSLGAHGHRIGVDGRFKFFCYGHQCQKKSAQEKPQKLGKDVMDNAVKSQVEVLKPRPGPRKIEGLSASRAAMERRMRERAEYVTESEQEESESEQTAHNFSAAYINVDDSDEESSTDSSEEDDNESGSEESDEFSDNEVVPSNVKNDKVWPYGKSRSRTDSANTSNSDSGTIGGGSDADCETGTDHESGSEDDRRPYSHVIGRSSQSPSVNNSQEKRPSAMEAMQKRLSFFSAAPQPVHIDAKSFLGLSPASAPLTPLSPNQSQTVHMSDDTPCHQTVPMNHVRTPDLFSSFSEQVSSEEQRQVEPMQADCVQAGEQTDCTVNNEGSNVPILNNKGSNIAVESVIVEEGSSAEESSNSSEEKMSRISDDNGASGAAVVQQPEKIEDAVKRLEFMLRDLQDGSYSSPVVGLALCPECRLTDTGHQHEKLSSTLSNQSHVEVQPSATVSNVNTANLNDTDEIVLRNLQLDSSLMDLDMSTLVRNNQSMTVSPVTAQALEPSKALSSKKKESEDVDAGRVVAPLAGEDWGDDGVVEDVMKSAVIETIQRSVEADAADAIRRIDALLASFERGPLENSDDPVGSIIAKPGRTVSEPSCVPTSGENLKSPNLLVDDRFITKRKQRRMKTSKSVDSSDEVLLNYDTCGVENVHRLDTTADAKRVSCYTNNDRTPVSPTVCNMESRDTKEVENNIFDTSDHKHEDANSVSMHTSHGEPVLGDLPVQLENIIDKRSSQNLERTISNSKAAKEFTPLGQSSELVQEGLNSYESDSIQVAGPGDLHNLVCEDIISARAVSTPENQPKQDLNFSQYYTPVSCVPSKSKLTVNAEGTSKSSENLPVIRSDPVLISPESSSSLNDQPSPRINRKELKSSALNSRPEGVFSPGLKLTDAKRRFFSETAQPVRIDPQSVFVGSSNSSMDQSGSSSEEKCALKILSPPRAGLQDLDVIPSAGELSPFAASTPTSEVFATPMTSMKPPREEKLLKFENDISATPVASSDLAQMKEAARERARLKSDSELGIVVGDEKLLGELTKKPSIKRKEQTEERVHQENVGSVVRSKPEASTPAVNNGKKWSLLRPLSAGVRRPNSMGKGDSSESSGGGTSPKPGGIVRGLSSPADSKENNELGKEKRRSLLTMLMPSKSLDSKSSSSSKSSDTGESSETGSRLRRSLLSPVMALKEKSSARNDKRPSTAGAKARPTSLSKSSGAKRGTNTFNELAPLLNNVGNSSERKAVLQERIQNAAPSLSISRGLSGDFDTGSDSVDDTLSLRSFRGQPQTEEDVARMLKRQQREARRRQRESEQRRLRKAQEIQRKLEEVQTRMAEVEQRGVEVEMALRGDAKDIQSSEAQLLQEWFDIIREKNVLLRYESELQIHVRELQLEDQHSRLEQALRDRVSTGGLMNEDDEESIMNQLVKVVEERSNLVALIEEDRLKEQRSEKDLEKIVQSKGFTLTPVSFQLQLPDLESL